MPTQLYVAFIERLALRAMLIVRQLEGNARFIKLLDALGTHTEAPIAEVIKHDSLH
jgi:hypothetical protein